MAGSTRQKLIETGYDLFAHNGFHAIGLDRILDEVGVSKQTFYNHFESKDELILEVLKHRAADEMSMFNRMIDEIGGTDPRARIYAIFDVLHAWLNAPEFNGCIFMTAAAEFSSQHDPAHKEAAAHARSIIALYRDLAERAGANDPLALAEQIGILVEGALVCRHMTGNIRASEIARATGILLLEQHLPNPAQT